MAFGSVNGGSGVHRRRPSAAVKTNWSLGYSSSSSSSSSSPSTFLFRPLFFPLSHSSPRVVVVDVVAVADCYARDAGPLNDPTGHPLPFMGRLNLSSLSLSLSLSLHPVQSALHCFYYEVTDGRYRGRTWTDLADFFPTSSSVFFFSFFCFVLRNSVFFLLLIWLLPSVVLCPADRSLRRLGRARGRRLFLFPLFFSHFF